MQRLQLSLSETHDECLKSNGFDKQTTWEIFEQYRDKPWSYTDCSLVVVARRLRLRHIFAFDYHFQQMELEVWPQ